MNETHPEGREPSPDETLETLSALVINLEARVYALERACAGLLAELALRDHVGVGASTDVS